MDGQNELWVRSDERQDWQGVFAIDGDSVILLANAEQYVRFDIFGEENEVDSESYKIDDEDVDEDAYEAFKDKLGDEVELAAERIQIQ